MRLVAPVKTNQFDFVILSSHARNLVDWTHVRRQDETSELDEVFYTLTFWMNRRPKFKVLGSIVIANAVLVMNRLIFSKRTTYQSLHHESVFKSKLTIPDLDVNVPGARVLVFPTDRDSWCLLVSTTSALVTLIVPTTITILAERATIRLVSTTRSRATVRVIWSTCHAARLARLSERTGQ